MQSQFTKTCLALIVFLLLVIASKPYLHPETAHAAGQIQYTLVAVPCLQNLQAFEDNLNKAGASGWQAVAVIKTGCGVVIMER
jgi:hypothetical protein